MTAGVDGFPHAVPSLDVPNHERASLRADTCPPDAANAFLHRRHPGQERHDARRLQRRVGAVFLLRASAPRPHADSPVPQLIVHQFDFGVPRASLRANTSPPPCLPAPRRCGSERVLRLHLSVPRAPAHPLHGGLCTGAVQTRPSGETTPLDPLHPTALA